MNSPYFTNTYNQNKPNKENGILMKRQHCRINRVVFTITEMSELKGAVAVVIFKRLLIRNRFIYYIFFF